MNKYAFILLLALAPALQAGEPPQQKKDESRKVHADPRFHGKVVVIGTSSESFGQAPSGEDLKTRKLDDNLDAEAPLPKPLPVGEQGKATAPVRR